jgi:hypothetical protein
VTMMNIKRLRWLSSPRAVLTAITVAIAIHATPIARAVSATKEFGIDMIRNTSPGELAKNSGRARDPYPDVPLKTFVPITYVRDSHRKPSTRLASVPRRAPTRTPRRLNPIDAVNPTPKLVPESAKTKSACLVALGSSFSDKNVSLLSLADFTIRSTSVRNLSPVRGFDREVI